jgi:hypothetical protein
MASITSKVRFEDFAPKNPDGTIDYAYRGYTYVVAAGDQTFSVRIYDGEDFATVIAPANARSCSQARELVEFITKRLCCVGVRFFCGSVGVYRLVDARTLEFAET